MASLSQCRMLSGCRAFTAVRPAVPKHVCNGSKYFMRRKDSFVVEVEVGEEEVEDIAVRRFMKAVTDSRIIDQMRVRRYTETKIERRKRRFADRIARKKLGLADPTWEEIYGQDTDQKPFEMFFTRDGDGNEMFYLPPIGGPDEFFPGTYMDNMDSKWGSYADPRSGYPSGGYMAGAGPSSYGSYPYQMGGQMGGYINQGGYQNAGGFNQNMGGYINQGGYGGGYMNPGFGGYQQGAVPQDQGYGYQQPPAPQEGGYAEQEGAPPAAPDGTQTFTF